MSQAEIWYKMPNSDEEIAAHVNEKLDDWRDYAINAEMDYPQYL